VLGGVLFGFVSFVGLFLYVMTANRPSIALLQAPSAYTIGWYRWSAPGKLLVMRYFGDPRRGPDLRELDTGTGALEPVKLNVPLADVRADPDQWQLSPNGQWLDATSAAGNERIVADYPGRWNAGGRYSALMLAGHQTAVLSSRRTAALAMALRS